MASEKPTLQRGNSVILDGAINDVDRQLPPLNKRETSSKFAVFMPPEEPEYKNPASIFLAGSIEMGKAIQWQGHLTKELQDLDITVCNPRRGNWSADLVPKAMDTLFKQQVEWELAALENVSVICFFFDKNTLSPVTMLELGLWAQSGKVVVCCHKDFWKSGNIHHVCIKYGVPYVKDYADLIPLVRQKLDDAKELKKLEGKDTKAILEEKTRLAEKTLRLADQLKKERDERDEANLPNAGVPTIHQYQKYIRPARAAFNASTRDLEDPVLKKTLWNDLCVFE